MIKIDKPLVLIGMMGAGKSTIAKELGARLGERWVDSDRLVEARAGKTIAEIFAQEGESAFRQKERDLAQELLGGKMLYPIIALGGGGFLQPPIQALCTKNAVTIWLQASLKTLHERLQHATLERKRPLLGGGEPRAILKELLKKREPIYAKADIIIPENNLEKMTDTIISYLSEKSISPLREKPLS